MDLLEGVGEEEMKMLREMHARKIQEVMTRRAQMKYKQTWLGNLRKLIPALWLLWLSWSCCAAEDPELNTLWLYRDSLRFATMSQQERNNEILASLAWNRQEGSFQSQTLHGWPVCDTCFRTFRGISKATWERRQREIREGKQHWEHGGTGTGRSYTQKGFYTRSWMNSFFCSLGDYQPDTGQVHLPPMDQKDVYNECKADLGDMCVSISHFNNIWNQEFPEVVIPKKKRLGKCETCEDLHEQIINSNDAVEREGIKQKRIAHIKFVRRERLVYHKWRKKCRDHPDKYVCVILDGMDQNKTNVPSFNTGESPDGVTVRIVGAIVHSVEKQVHAYLITHFTKETNSMVEVLRRVLESRASLPPVLVLQLDNTSQENKNTRLFAFLATLVRTGVFEKIVVNFLPVGHTHEDIDQIFSRFSKELQGVCARSIDELIASLERAVKGVIVKYVMKVCDFWFFVQPFNVGYALYGFYAFEITMRDPGQVVLRYKTTMASDVWLPCGRFADDRSFAPVMLREIHPPVPTHFSFVVPGVLPVEMLRGMLARYKHRLARQRSVVRFQDEPEGACVTWWTSFLSAEETRIANMCSTCVDIKSELATIVVRRNKGMTQEKKEANTAKQRRKQELLVELQSHACADREQGNLDVPAAYSWILQRILANFHSDGLPQEHKEEHKTQTPLPINLAEGFSDSESDDEGYAEVTDGLGLLKSGQSKPVSYRRRGERIRKGMFIATLPDKGDTHMGAHPFWIQKVLRITKRRVKVHYYGPHFLGVYMPLVDVDNDNADYVDYFRRGEFTTLHWNIKLTGKYKSHEGGKLSASDQAYLSLDVRVLWDKSSCSSSSDSNKHPKRVLPESVSQASSRSSKRKK